MVYNAMNHVTLPRMRELSLAPIVRVVDWNKQLLSEYIGERGSVIGWVTMLQADSRLDNWIFQLT
jgi:hypothetical protein